MSTNNQFTKDCRTTMVFKYALSCILLTIVQVKVCNSMEIEQLHVPKYMNIGETTVLLCKFNMKNQNLYSVIWHKDNEPFYRFAPGQSPQRHVYEVDGVLVDVDLSNKQIVVLKNVTIQTEGRYRCEVSAEAPSFTTVSAEATLHIIALPEGSPEVEGVNPIYKIGDTINLNCSTKPSHPVSDIEWLVNGHVVTGTSTIESIDNGLKYRISNIRFIVGENYLQERQIRIRCYSILPNFRNAMGEKETRLTIDDRKSSFLVQARDKATGQKGSVIGVIAIVISSHLLVFSLL